MIIVCLIKEYILAISCKGREEKGRREEGRGERKRKRGGEGRKGREGREGEVRV